MFSLVLFCKNTTSNISSRIFTLTFPFVMLRVMLMDIIDTDYFYMLNFCCLQTIISYSHPLEELIHFAQLLFSFQENYT